MLEEILKECELAEEYLQAMKKTMLNDKGDCDNVRMHIAKIKGKVNTLLIAGVVERSEQLPCGDLMKHNFSLSKIGRCITCDRAKEKAR